MTNAEKYLKDEKALFELPVKLRNFLNEKKYGVVTATLIMDFFKAEVKPELTKTEENILKIIPVKYVTIRRIGNNLQVDSKDEEEFACLCAFNHLFQFIKSGEKYSINELLGDEI